LYTVEGNLAAANAAIAGAAKMFSEEYSLPYVAHNQLEPLSCTVNYISGVSCDVYVSTQVASSVQALVNQLTGLPLNKINVHTTWLGGGLGRRIETDFVSQAIQVAMAVGRPVQLVWPREQNFLRDQYRPLSLVQVNAGLNASGGIVGWACTNVSESILGQRGYPVGAVGDSQATERPHCPITWERSRLNGFRIHRPCRSVSGGLSACPSTPLRLSRPLTNWPRSRARIRTFFGST
jgi:isoquinoline 1-oxidoreductase beta subunit